MWISTAIAATLAISSPSESSTALAAEDHTSPPTDAQAAQWGENRKLKVLYAGMPEGSRETVFVDFLRVWFDEVGVMDLTRLDAEAAAPYDVVVADWASHYGNDGYSEDASSALRSGKALGDGFTKPIVAIASVADHLRPRHKLDWF